jgi:dTDP-4-dehydrorhamnose 3,5-epimerase-like enzyme
MDIKLINFRSIGDDRGQLVAIEQDAQIPFAIKRVYYIFATGENVRRGFHAHKRLQQVAVCVSGFCTFELFDGVHTQTQKLDSPTQGLYVGHQVWREMYDFSPDCVLMVLASEKYDETDYVRDRGDFISFVKESNR